MSNGDRGKRSKREVMREKRRKQERQQRLIIVLGVAAVAFILLALIVGPTIQQAIMPVGDVIEITPFEYPMAEGTTMGDPNAPVKIDVFEDFQCPSCAYYTENVEKPLAETYITEGQVYYVFHNFPMIDDRAPGNESDQAANASLCAAEQGEFWDYHAMLYANWDGENEGAFRDRRLIAFAETLGLDMDQFTECFEENRYEEDINADIQLAEEMGVNSTPTVFVNGEQVSPGFVPTFEQLSEAIDAELASQ